MDSREEFLEWARGAAVPIATTEPGSGTDDLLPLLPLLRDARIVGLGESTHGTREFFQLKHRILELLIEHAGATRFLIEASLPEALEVDRHVRSGEPPVDEAVAGMRFWVWDTDEVHDLVRDLRRRRLRTGADLRFLGVDLQFPALAARRLAAYLQQRGDQVPTGLELLGDEALTASFPGLAQELQQQAAAAVAALPVDLPETETWCATVLSGWLEMRSDDIWDVRRARDARMAELALATAGSGPAVLWAHDQHVERDGFAHVTTATAPLLSMGGYLARTLGQAYRPVRFSFGAGGFSAVGPDGLLADQEVTAPEPGSLDAALDEVGHDLFALDLRTAPRRWLSTRPQTKLIGSGFSADPDLFHAAQDPAEQADLLVHARRTTASRRARSTIRTTPRVPEVRTELPPLADWVLDEPRTVGAPQALALTDGGAVLIAGDRWRQRRSRLLARVDATPWRGRAVTLSATLSTPAPSAASCARLLLHATGPAWRAAASPPPDPAGSPTRLSAVLHVPADAETLLVEVSAAGPCPVVVRDVELA